MQFEGFGLKAQSCEIMRVAGSRLEFHSPFENC